MNYLSIIFALLVTTQYTNAIFNDWLGSNNVCVSSRVCVSNEGSVSSDNHIIINGVHQGCCNSNNSVKGSGNITEKQIELPDSINSITISGIGNLHITTGDKTSLVIKAEDNLHQHLDQIVSGKSGLTLQPNNNIHATREIVYLLTLKEAATRIHAQGATKVNADSINNPKVELEAQGSAQIRIKELLTQALTARALGASSINIDGGGTKEQSITCEGASKYNGKNFTSINSSVHFGGASNGSLHSDDTIKGTLSGASSLKLYGNGKHVKIHTSGVSSYGHAS